MTPVDYEINFKKILPEILKGKDREVTIEHERRYKAYHINKALSKYVDCIFFANAMNINKQLDARLQIDFLLNTIRAYKRGFVPKYDGKDSDIVMLGEYYQCNREKAAEIYKLLSDDQLNEIRKRQSKGGLKND